MNDMSKKTFRRLANHVAEEYRKKGYSVERAHEIGTATAGKVANEKHEKEGSK